MSSGPAARSSLSPLAPPRGTGAVRIWLLVVAAMVYAMILVGGATRLTDSGLSITEWKPLLGAVPPLSEADWVRAFDQYRTMTAQFERVNPDMDMDGFRSIYWWEWGHRQLGRTIGLVFFLPFAFFLATGRTSPRLRPHLFALFALGGLQGLIGWWMVASGVGTDLVSVAPYRLMTHFSLALLIISYCFWLWLELGRDRRPVPREAAPWAMTLLWLTGVQMALGALVAGLDAGRGYTDWPLMSGRFVPEALLALDPVWRNVFENEATAQFLHRMTAYALCLTAFAAAWRFRSASAGFRRFALLTLGQGTLGVVTLVHAAPVDLSLCHQGLGVILLLTSVYLVWRTRGAEDSVVQPVFTDVDKGSAPL
ncbi:MAG: COX15/CtaA family protein [Alphaproteobacteria bacterium]|nr:COX15/CtaA family protein [Alphaproteobacteria bacterium]